MESNLEVGNLKQVEQHKIVELELLDISGSGAAHILFVPQSEERSFYVLQILLRQVASLLQGLVVLVVAQVERIHICLLLPNIHD